MSASENAASSGVLMRRISVPPSRRCDKRYFRLGCVAVIAWSIVNTFGFDESASFDATAVFKEATRLTMSPIPGIRDGFVAIRFTRGIGEAMQILQGKRERTCRSLLRNAP
tara:strand:+ start:871 stop:1203 length:333 start_codon:yes stop_codon:yes gene_type:complete